MPDPQVMQQQPATTASGPSAAPASGSAQRRASAAFVKDRSSNKGQWTFRDFLVTEKIPDSLADAMLAGIQLEKDELTRVRTLAKNLSTEA